MAANQRPNMRSMGFHQRTVRPHARQVAKNIAAKQIPNIWPIARVDKSSRGLRRNGNTCFRLSGLQALLHLPKFLQWIISHNTSDNQTPIFPCRPAHVIHAQLDTQMSDEFLSKNPDIGSIDDLPEKEMTRLEKELQKKEKKRRGSTLKRCPACAVKALVQYYWGTGNLSLSGVPMDILSTNAELIEVHQIDNMLRQSTPGAAMGAADVQEDPEEMQTRLLTACLESVNYNLAAYRDWKTRYEALFILQSECIWRGACGHQQPLPFGTNVDGIGFNNIAILANGSPDSVEEAIRREFRPRTLNVGNYTQCMTQQQRTETVRIEGSPEYLRIKLSIINRNGSKNENPIKIPDVLNLSEYQAVVGDPPPLKYRLSSVLAHGGINRAGHWVASVRGPKKVFYINDHRAVQRPLSHLKANPQVYGQMGMQAVVLMYKRFETRL